MKNTKKTDEKTLPSIPGIVDPMLLLGTFTRAQIMDKVRELRPDFKDPSAAVSNGFRRQVALGKHPALVEVYKERKARAVKSGKRTKANPDGRMPLKDRLAKVDAWAARMDTEIMAGFAHCAAIRAKGAAEPRMRRIWP